MEEEARIILRDAPDDGSSGLRDLAAFIRECSTPLGDVEPELPPRGPMCKPLGSS